MLQRIDIHLPALFLDSKNTDRSKSAHKFNCILSGLASSWLDIITFNNKIRGAYVKKDVDDIQQ